MSNIQEQIVQQRETARECEISGGDCAPEWDALEELQAEASHQKAKSEEKPTSLQQYCNDNPDAAECRIYED